MENNAASYSVYKDGKPRTIIERVIGMAYSVIILFSAVLCLKMWKSAKARFNSWRLIAAVSIGATTGWAWNLFTVLYDKRFAGWEYAEWSVIGLFIAKIPIEDWLFYLIFGSIFIFIKAKIPNIGKSSIKNVNLTLSLMVFLTGLVFVLSGPGGKSIAVAFAIPGLAMLVAVSRWLNLPRFFLTGAVVMLAGAGWDMLATNVIPNINGMAWASQWVYVTFDSLDNAYHSKLWLDYSACKWAWIGRVPIEVMFWFNCAGWWFIYGLSEILNVEKR
jgi:hypothetical protein